MDLSEQERRLIGVLDRQATCDALSALVSAIKPDRPTIPMAATALGLDANVFLRLAGHSRAADIVDYLTVSHSAPLILPGQAIQEFWNNQLQAVDTVATSLKKQFDALKSSIVKIDKKFGEYSIEFESLLERFSAEYGHVYDEATTRRTVSILESLSKRAIVSYAPRLRYKSIADMRKRTRTPPGFRDDGDGDFFIWVDLLTGLQRAQLEGINFARIVLVTGDKKIDWTRGGTAHPILVAEVQELLRVPFEIWTIDRLSEEISAA